MTWVTRGSDLFDRSNETPLAAGSLGWSKAGDPGAFNLISNHLEVVTQNIDSGALATSLALANDQFSRARISTASSTATAGSGLYVRHGAAGQIGYRLVVTHSAGNNIEIARFNTDQSYHSLDNFANSWTNGDLWELRVQGARPSILLTVLKNGVVVRTYTDTAVSDGIESGVAGIAYSSDSGGTDTVDSWEGGEWVADGYPATSLIDNFNRANGSVQGSTASDGVHVWSTTSINGTGQGAEIQNNVLHLVSGTGDLYITSDTEADCEAYFDIASVPAAAQYVFVAARIQDVGTANWDGYGVIWINGSGWQIRKYTNGSGSAIGATVTGNDLVAGDSIGIDVAGDVIRALRKTSGEWIEVASRTDATYSAAGKIGWEFSSGEIDNFGGGPFGGAAPSAIGPVSIMSAIGL